MPTKRKRLRKQIDAEANRFIDKVYGEYIENVVATQGKPAIRRKLRKIFREHLFFQIEVEGAADLAEFDSILDKMERLLKRRIQDFRHILETAEQLKQAEYAATIAEQKSVFLYVSEVRLNVLKLREELRVRYTAYCEELSKVGIDIPDFDSLKWGIRESEKSRSKVNSKVNQYILKAEREITTDPFAKFRRWRTSRKQLIRFLWQRKKRLELQKKRFYPIWWSSIQRLLPTLYLILDSQRLPSRTSNSHI